MLPMCGNYFLYLFGGYMTILSEAIVYIWLIPLVVFIIIPLTLQCFHLILRLTHFMFAGQKQVEAETASTIPMGHLGKIS